MSAIGLIFGANGQDGHYLQRYCQQQGIQPVCISRSGAGLLSNVANFEEVSRIIKQFHPSYVFHLAASSTTRHSAIFENHAAIATGTINILEAVRVHAPEAKVFITGSGLQFRNTGEPISEDDEFEANDPYSVARIHSVYAARYFRALGIRTYIGYLFHHESPLRKPTHVSRLVVDSVKRIAKGSSEILELGDISVAKEWTFAGDVANGILKLIQQDDIKEAVIGSGKAYSIEHWLECCFGLIGKDWRNYIKIKDGFTAEYHKLVSNPATMNHLGWRISVDIEELAAMMYSHVAESV